MTQTRFNTLPLKAGLLDNLDSLGYTQMTPIQADSLPAILAGKDVIGQGKTGSGKTAAFALGLLNKLAVDKFRIQTLVLSPTRELADQISSEIRRLARGIHNIKVLTICGGQNFGAQAHSLEHGAHIIVGTPGRIADHLGRETLKLNHVDTLVLDEADRMLEMGFQDTLDDILRQVPDNRQTLMFSATFPKEINSIASRITQQAVTVKAAEQHDSRSIEEHFYKVIDAARGKALRLVLQQFQPTSCIVFCNTRKSTQAIADELQSHGFSAIALHGDIEQRDRDETLLRFANLSIRILVATDVAARGLDIDSVDAVVNFEIAHEAETHVHRVGRTGRAGNKGLALSLFSEEEGHRVARLDSDLEPLQNHEPLPDTSVLKNTPLGASMVTLKIDGGKKQKLRPGDILGALTRDDALQGSQVGKIKIFDRHAYVAVAEDVVRTALNVLGKGRMKGKNFRAREMS